MGLWTTTASEHRYRAGPDDKKEGLVLSILSSNDGRHFGIRFCLGIFRKRKKPAEQERRHRSKGQEAAKGTKSRSQAADSHQIRHDGVRHMSPEQGSASE